MKRLTWVAVLILLAACCAPAMATEPAGEISSSTLASMGLGSARKISDREGSQVRGKAAFAFTYSITNGVHGPRTTVPFAGGVLSYSFSSGGGAVAFAR